MVRQLDPNDAAAYLREALSQTPRLLSFLDRETHSASYGSCDREHWAWKFRDFPLGMAQSAVYPLAMLWRHPFPGNPYHNSPQILAWTIAGMEETLRRQHANGAFDAFTPNEQDPGPTLALVHILCATSRLLEGEISAPFRSRLLSAIRKGCDFGAIFEQNHGFVSNHWALFALAFLDGHELLREARYRQHAEQIIDRILAEQSADGWYREYGGPDPGYESLGINYLALYWQRTGSAQVLDSLRRSVEFYAYCLHPDGSVGGVYGSRHTSLYFPAGFELLAGEIPMAAAVARFMRAKLSSGNVLTPAVSDAENLPPLLTSYLEAGLSAANGRDVALRLPCEVFQGVRRFQESGICVAGTSAYYAVVNAAKGGVCRVFDRRSAHLAYEDSGYLIRASGRTWSSQLSTAGAGADREEPETIYCTADLCEARPLLPTPLKFMFLRFLNLTLFRSPSLGSWIRGRIVARLILAKHSGPFRLHREISFREEEIGFRDALQAEQPAPVEEVALARSFTGIHMGSAKYFHPAELTETLLPDTRGLASELTSGREAVCEFSIRFFAGASPELVSGAGMHRSAAARPEATLINR